MISYTFTNYNNYWYVHFDLFSPFFDISSEKANNRKFPYEDSEMCLSVH